MWIPTYQRNMLFSSCGGGVVDEAQSKPIGMVNRKCRENEDSYGSE
jgi:hypothetical protein